MSKNKVGFYIIILIGIILNLVTVFVIARLDEFGTPFVLSYFAIYLSYALILFSSKCDAVLSLMYGTRKPSSKEQSNIQAFIEELRNKAAENGEPFISDVRVRMMNDLYPNAMAYGHASIALTTGLTQNCEPEEIRAVIAHEIGHLVNQDTKKQIIVLASFSLLLLLGMVSVRVLGDILAKSGAMGAAAALVFALFMAPALIGFLVYLGWTAARSFSAQKIEFAADAYSVRLTQDNGLIDFFDQIEHMEASPSGFLAAQMRSHPPVALRRDEAERVLATI